MTDLWFDVTGDGPPVVLLHQGVVDSRIWGPVVPLLAERHRVIRYDQRGFGRSPMPNGPYSLVDDLVGVLDASGTERAALAGASRGGGIALTAAVECPERVTSLALIGAALPGHHRDLDVSPELEQRWDEAEETGDYGTMAEIDMEIWAPMGADPELRAMFVENAVGSNSEHPTTDEPVAGRLREIAAPALVVTGGRDVAAIDEVGEILARDIPVTRRAVIEEADHMIPWRSPEELSHLVLAFLAAQKGLS